MRDRRFETEGRKQETRDRIQAKQEKGDKRQERVLCTDRKITAIFDISMNLLIGADFFVTV